MKKANSTKRKINNKVKQTKKKRLEFLKFLPAIAISLIATVIWSQPHIASVRNGQGVLAYATNTTHAGLLSATNSNRANNGVGALGLNSKLNAAAQAKANDMINRNYWSHQTPDGQQPWVFITNAGYPYLAAGENLAYGFTNSNATVTGWMNSPSHKANMLSANYTEVGFGMADSPDFVGNGPQTVVVAMYGKPQGAPEAAPQAQAPKPAAPKPAVQNQSTENKPTPTPQPVAETPQETKPEEPVETAKQEEKKDSVTVAYADANGSSGGSANKEVQRIQLLTGGNAVWSASAVVFLVCSIGFLWFIHRSLRFRKWLKASEKFVGQHIHFDLAVLALIFLGYILLSTSGVIR